MTKDAQSLFKKLFFLIVILIPECVFANHYSSIDYRITPLFDRDVPTIKVEAEVKGNLSDKVFFDLPYKWANAEYFKQIKNIQIIHPHAQFKICKVKNPQIIVTLAENTQSMLISYEIHQKPGNPLNVNETIIRRELVHSPGVGLFITPSDLKETDTVQFTLTWAQIPDEWNTLSSYGIGKSLKFSTTAPNLYRGLYVAGKCRMYQIADDKSPVYLTLQGTFDMKDDLISSFLGEVMKSQRAFFEDWDFPHYAISLIEGDDPYSMAGTGFRNGFAAYLPMGKKRKDYYLLFAHELLHTWIGGKIRNNGRQSELNYWWSEGFTEYYSRVIALRSGGLSMEEFLSECNTFLRRYYLSPVLNESNACIKRDFWKDKDVETLPYCRGFVFALYLNSLIKQHSPNNSLDDVMRDLFKTSPQREFSAEHFKNIVNAYIPQGITKSMSQFIDKGKTITLEALAAVLPLEKIKLGRSQLGCDRQAFRKEKRVKNIDKRSNAYKAGLRNGDKIIEWNFPKGPDPDQIATIKTVDKIIEFRPESPEKKEVYQFKSDLSSDDIARIREFFGKK